MGTYINYEGIKQKDYNLFLLLLKQKNNYEKIRLTTEKLITGKNNRTNHKVVTQLYKKQNINIITNKKNG